ncbi:MAG TPA: glycosyltransferase family 1 protein [Deltaproteobacteria bacterium]|nr:glycosyltransferase family 1 protein [Deltaproteobacteria bacterium]
MRIAVLAHNLRDTGGLSVGKNIVHLLPKIAPQHYYLFLIPVGTGYEIRKDSTRVNYIEIPEMGLIQRALFEKLKLPKLIKDFKPDLIWGLGNIGLRNPPCRQAILFHDAHLIYPERHYALETWTRKMKKRLLKRHLRKCLPRVDVVFCQTETAKKRFADVFNYESDHIFICPNAVSGFVTLPDEPKVPSTIEPYADRFKLFVLTKYSPHKNIEGIVETYATFREELESTLVILTIEESQHPNVPHVLEKIRALGLDNVIITVGRLRQDQLAEYFLACDALLLPTLLESFSGTYLEAMHFGVPILTSDLDFAHDVCGKAALYFDPWQPAAMKEAILKLKTNASLREELIQQGKERLRSSFRSWPDVVREALDILGVAHE